LTELGARYLADVRRLVNDSDEVLAGMSQSRAQVEGRLRIRVPTGMVLAFMAKLLAGFQQAYPLVSLDVVVADRPTDPDEEGFDLSLGAATATMAGVIDELICPLHRLLGASPTYLAERGTPTHPQTLAEHDCLLFTPVGKTWTFESDKGLITLDVRPKLSANDMNILAAAAAQGNGIALLPTYAAAQYLRAGTLVEVLQSYRIPTVWIKAWVPERRAHIARVRKLIDFLKAHLSPIPPWDIELATNAGRYAADGKKSRIQSL
jgi:DNA-binding transcriptional LysR family regulator